MRGKLSTIFICYATLCKWGVKRICYPTCANDVKLVQMTIETRYNIHCYATFADKVKLVQMGVETQYKCSLVMQLVQMSGETHVQYNVHLLCNLCRWCRFKQWTSGCNIKITMATKLFRQITDHGMHGGDTDHNNIHKVHVKGVYRATCED